MKTIALTEAEKGGYKPITQPYKINSPDKEKRERETWMFDRVCADLCGTNAVLVPVHLGFEIWRHTSELLTENSQADGRV